MGVFLYGVWVRREERVWIETRRYLRRREDFYFVYSNKVPIASHTHAYLYREKKPESYLHN